MFPPAHDQQLLFPASQSWHPAALVPSSKIVAEGFVETLRRIELDRTRVKLATQHYNSIKNLIEERLPNSQVRQIGSFQRHTKIRPVSVVDSPGFDCTPPSAEFSPIDIDALVCLGDACSLAQPGCGLFPVDALQLVRSVLCSHKQYRLMEPKQDSPVVVLTYSDEFSVELAPCFRNRVSAGSWFRDPPSYLVGAGEMTWQKADYDFDSAYITSKNQQCKGRLIPCIKLIKAFLRNKRVPLKSFHVEILCTWVLSAWIEVLDQSNIHWSYDHAFAFFLRVVPFFLNQPACFQGSMSPPLQLTEAAVSTIDTTIENFARLAEKLGKLSGYPDELSLWKEFFGPPFPSAIES